MSLDSLTADLLDLIEKWEKLAKKAESTAQRAEAEDDTPTTYYQNGIAEAYYMAAAELTALLEESEEADLDPTQADETTFARVTLAEVEYLLRRANIQVTNLYEDAGPIFTAVFPRLLSISVNERIQTLEERAPGIIILETGTLSQTGEFFIDFAFSQPLGE